MAERFARSIILLAVLLFGVSTGFAIPKIAYAGMSALLPGSGEIVLGKYNRGTIMIATDIIAWTAYLDTGRDITNLGDSYKKYAGLYAGADINGSDRYFQNLQSYTSSDEFNDYNEMMARNYYLVYMADGFYDIEGYNAYLANFNYDESQAWNWQNSLFQKQYRKLRTNYQEARLNHNLSLGILILNRAISLLDIAFIKTDGKQQALYFSPAPDAGVMLNYRLDF